MGWYHFHLGELAAINTARRRRPLSSAAGATALAVTSRQWARPTSLSGKPSSALYPAWMPADAEIRLSDGRSVEVGGRAWQLAAAQNFTADIGDSVTVHGFDENGVFEAGQIDNQSNGQTLSLRDTTGRPLWAGRGRG